MAATLEALAILALFACHLPTGTCDANRRFLREFLIESKVTQDNDLTHRVIGGTDVPENEFVPYQVSLQYSMPTGVYQHFCGGSIISADRILTAAHCCDGLNLTRMWVYAGVRDLNDTTGQRSKVQECLIHPRYEELVTSDIAIIQLERPLTLDGERTAVIELMGPARVSGGVQVTLTGWGLRWPVPLPLPNEFDSVNYPNILQTMTYHTITNDECRNSGMVDLTETEICARGIWLRSACSGDSGGPLVTKGSDGRLRQVGIVSYGLFICGVVYNVPDVYTRVSEFDDWIRQQIE